MVPHELCTPFTCGLMTLREQYHTYPGPLFFHCTTIVRLAYGLTVSLHTLLPTVYLSTVFFLPTFLNYNSKNAVKITHFRCLKSVHLNKSQTSHCFVLSLPTAHHKNYTEKLDGRLLSTNIKKLSL